MNHIPQHILDFLRDSAPFEVLDEHEMNRLAQSITVAYFSQEDVPNILKQQQGGLFLIYSGQYSVKDSAESERHVSDGDYFGCDNLWQKQPNKIAVTVDSPGLVYCIPKNSFAQCVSTHPNIGVFFRNYTSEQIYSDQVDDSKSMWLYKPISEVISDGVVSEDINSSILQGVQVMSKSGVSSLVITDNQLLVGILTDRDIRNRVVAQQTDVNLAVSEIMTRDPVKISDQRTLFDALCVMTEHNVHHLPVVDKSSGVPLGMLTASDMIRHQRGNVLFVINELTKAPSLYELTRLSWQLPHYFSKHAKRLGDFDIAGKVLSQATDIMTRKLIGFYQQQHGEAPMEFCWLVYGSQAREDQTMGSDQDNGLLFATEPNPEQSAYFADMAEYVCRGLDKCGIKLCTGNIMASNPALRMSIKQAVQQAQSWVREPSPEAILNCNIFLDVRAVAGNRFLLSQLHVERKELLKQSRFIAALTRHASDGHVPLSMFQKFVYKKGLPKKDCIDMKNSGVAIINNLVRIYSLANGLTMPSIPHRLEGLLSHAGLSSKDVKNLRDIWLFLNRLRWRHQIQNKVTDNYVSISDLSSIEKYQLKEAMRVIRRTQQAAVFKFAGGLG
ncbi:MAG: signal transduction protein [Alteromonadaceae bacterium]|nr:signal transduction protein [Alteromonadaceae bacterium]MBB18028.1 signal transduction protein [Rickettsiales bacterium]